LSGVSSQDAENSSDHASPKTFWPVSEKASIFAEDLFWVSLGAKKAALLMLELPSESRAGGAFAALLSLDKPDASRVVRLGMTGEYSTQISGQEVNGKLVVVWHDGGLSSSRLRLVRLDPERFTVEKENVIERSGPMASPVLARVAPRPVLVWSETSESGAAPRSLVYAATVSSALTLSPKTKVAETRFLYPSPDVTVAEESIGLTFRDDEDRDDTPEYYFLLLAQNGRPVSKRARISQADGLRGPSLAMFEGVFFGATIRSFQRSFLVGLNRFTREGTKIGGEFQVYADKTDFVRVDISENQKTLMMVYAEDRLSSGRVLAGQVLCKSEK
jgi:hypothetical protein